MNIDQMAYKLKLPYLRNNYQILIEEAEHTNMNHREFLASVLENEITLRNSNSIKARLRQAKFPYKKYIEDFELDNYKADLKKKINKINNLDFIENNENIIMIGNPGSGKTHYAISLGIMACMENKTVLFVSVPNLIIEIKEAMSNNQLQRYKRRFEKYDLVILDELGYVSFDKTGCEILFNLLSNRNDNGSIIITSNLKFDRWEEIFKDPMLTGAMIDRLAHKAHVLDMTVERSFRLNETLDWLKTNN